MDLSTYIAESLRQIREGVMAAQEAAKGTEFSVNPKPVNTIKNPTMDGYVVADSVEKVEFEVEVTEIKRSKAEGGAKVDVWVFDVGGGGETSKEASAQNRLRFDVPVRYPYQRA